MKVHIGGDHAGFRLKEELALHLRADVIEVVDHGTLREESVDYPDVAHSTARAVETDGIPGILVCGSGNGVCMTANKHAGIRAALCWNAEIARLSRLHNDANMICLPARFVSVEEAKRMVDIFLGTSFEGGRHSSRVAKITC